MTHRLWVIVHSKIKFKKPNTFNNTRIEHRLRHFWYRWLRCSLLNKIKYNSSVLIGQKMGLKWTVIDQIDQLRLELKLGGQESKRTLGENDNPNKVQFDSRPPILPNLTVRTVYFIDGHFSRCTLKSTFVWPLIT